MFTYITRVEVPSRAAQSKQILAMSQAFYAVLAGRFSLVAKLNPAGERSEIEFPFRTLRGVGGTAPTYLQFCFEAARTALLRRRGVVYTRDIAIAAAVVMLGGRAIYEAHRAPIGRVARALTRQLVRARTFGLVTISQALADYYRDELSARVEKTLVAHDGVFPELYRPLTAPEVANARRTLGLPIDKSLVVHTGSLYKGGAELFETIAAVNSANILLLHVGGSKEECADWHRYYVSRGIQNIRFIPHQAPAVVRQYQQSADALLYVATRKSPIFWCTSPLKLFEYMASGVPLIAARIGSVAEVVDESCAYCFDPDQPGSMLDAWARYSSDVDPLARARKARALAAVQYSWYTRARRIVAFSEEWRGGTDG